MLTRPKFRRWLTESDCLAFLAGLAQAASVAHDPAVPAGLSPDPDDDNLIALARAVGADYLVSGDGHLTKLADPSPPILTPREFLETLSGSE